VLKNKIEKFPIISYFIFLIVLIPQTFLEKGKEDWTFIFAFIAAIIGISITFFVFYHNKKKKKPAGNSGSEKKKIMKIFSILYGLVAALAITNALDIFINNNRFESFLIPENDTMNFTLTDSFQEVPQMLLSNEMAILICFFFIAPFFYHCGLAFLSGKTESELKENVTEPKIIFSAFLVFLSGIMLYFAAGSVGSLLQFSLWIFFLMISDVIWILYNYRKILKGHTHNFSQWIHFDTIMGLFLTTILVTFGMSSASFEYHHYFLFLIVFVYWTLTDYSLSWETFVESHSDED
jgi:hypothetical protein